MSLRILFRFLSASALLVLLFDPNAAWGADCGGTTACSCGDKVVNDVVLTGNLTCSSGNGLTIDGDAVDLDCGGFTISMSPAWSGGGTTPFGVVVNATTGNSVKNCTISGFYRGLRLNGSVGTVVDTVTLSSNGAGGVGYGGEVIGGASSILLDTLTVSNNSDEGLHFSSGSHHVSLLDSTFSNNGNEQIYLLGVSDIAISGGSSSGGTVGAYVKDASNSTIFNHTFAKVVHVTGTSSGNVFTSNTYNGGIRYDYYNASPYRIPSANEVVGGTISATSDCIRLDSSLTTTFTDVALGSCGTQLNGANTIGPCSVTFIGLSPSLSGNQGCTVRVGWNWDIHVQNGSSQPLANAAVRINNSFGSLVVDEVTDDDGDIVTQQVISQQGASTLDKRTPHVLMIDLEAHGSYREIVTLSAHRTSTITLNHQ